MATRKHHEAEFINAYQAIGAAEGANACLAVLCDMRMGNKGGELKRALGQLYSRSMGAKERNAALEGFCWAVERQLMRGAVDLPEGWDKPPFKELPLGEPRKRAKRAKQAKQPK